MRRVGSWLDAPKNAFNNAREQANESRPKWRGEKLGLPERGPGSAAPVGRRLGAFLIDIVLAALVAALFTMPDYPGNWSLVAWAVITVVPVSFFGATPGMAALRIWVARVDGAVMVGPLRAALRCVLTFLIIPAVMWNFDGRSWHDRLSGTIVLRR
ncbi:RDD family protein [Saccharopolyspora hirsuta]|uniref:RDD family protein n=1 Tax=Saccharopolyspora hirsuta TaxID=1837 RepID=A0A5M7BB95_SACHI|nr:RDD family protein [Saccharopolyspora hirsuta]KAA5826722.1 RDD family protein [Saccharopolyspora hirsuta]